jgi:hypothetical protein
MHFTMGPMAALSSSLAHGGGFVRMAAAEHAVLSRLYLFPVFDELLYQDLIEFDECREHYDRTETITRACLQQRL